VNKEYELYMYAVCMLPTNAMLGVLKKWLSALENDTTRESSSK